MRLAEHHFADHDHPAIRRLERLTSLDESALNALHHAIGRIQRIERRKELLREGMPINGEWLIVEGWTARARHLPDGRRQLVSFGLPGDLIGYCQFDGAISSSTVVALNTVKICPLPHAELSHSLARAYAISRAMDEAHLMAQVTRIGRLNAHERIVDFLLEMYGRLKAIGLATNGRFTMPLTQEMFSDALGLTPVHINRTLQQARRAGGLSWTGREVTLYDPDALALSVGRIPVQAVNPRS